MNQPESIARIVTWWDWGDSLQALEVCLKNETNKAKVIRKKFRELHRVKIGLSGTTQLQRLETMKCVNEYFLEELLTSEDLDSILVALFWRGESFVEFVWCVCVGGRVGGVALISDGLVSVLFSNTFFHSCRLWWLINKSWDQKVTKKL